MNWEKDSIIFIIAFLILRELISFVVWFIKRKDKNLDEIAYKFTKDKLEWWRDKHHNYLDFPTLSYFFMVKRALEKRKFDSMFAHIDFLARESKLYDDSIEKMMREKKNIEEERKRLDAVKDNIETSYLELHKTEIEREAMRFVDFLDFPIYKIVWFKLTERQKDRKLSKAMETLKTLKDKRKS